MRPKFTFALVLCLPTFLQAQSKSEMQQVLERLERLEEQNRALFAEVQSLRKELAASGTTTAEPAPAEPPLEERVAVVEHRTDEQAQSNVESEHRLPVQLTGMLLFNAFLNGRSSNNQGYPVAASASVGQTSGGATLRQSVIGLKFQGPDIFAGGKISGSVYMDFFDGLATTQTQFMRLRIASLDFDWKNTTFSVGQDKPIISPREPNSIAQVGVSPLTAAGNLWQWEPQARIEQRFGLGEDTGLLAQVGVFQTSEGTNTIPSEYQSSLAAARPSLEGRFEFWHQFERGRRIEVAPGFHVSSSHVAGQSVPSDVYSVDWLIRPAPRIDFSGMFFGGENVAVLGALRQGIVFRDPTAPHAVSSRGGWAQLSFRATGRLSFNFYGGQQDDRNRDLLTGGIGKNQTYAGNVMYRFGQNVLASFEASQTRTTYIGSGTRLNPHYDLAFAYLF